MDTIVWSSSYSVGVRVLDEQHQTIVKLINQLGANSDLDSSREFISDLLNNLTNYAINHFKAEEALLEANDYPGLDNQKTEHREYRFKVAVLCQEVMNDKSSVPDELLQFLQEWWVLHIMESDMDFKEYLSARGVQ